MKEFAVLRILDRFSGLIKRFDIDYFQLRLILKLKLTLDSRSVPTLLSNSKNIESRNIPVLTMLMYGFMGLMISLFVWIPFSVFYKMNIIIGMIIFMIMATMVSDFSTVLLDVKDKSILSPRPIKGKTLKFAKIIHVFYYLIRITLTLSGPTVIMSFFKYGAVFSLLLLVEIVLICGFVMFITSILYFVILSLFDGEKLKDIINYFQIILTIFITISYQFIGRMFNLSEMTISFTPKWWNYLLPSTWFSAPLTLLTEKSYSSFYLIASIQGLVIPIVAFIIYIKAILPYFDKNLQKLSNNSRKNNKKVKASGGSIISRLLCSGSCERAVYKFTLDMISSERKLKLQLYPSLAFAIVMPFIFIFMNTSSDNFYESLSALKNSKSYLSLYISIAMASLSVNFINRSEKYRGAWIYRALPVHSPAMILKGAFKAFVIRFNMPIMAVLGVICILLYGPIIIPDIILILFNMFLLLIIFAKLVAHNLPFCRDFHGLKEGTNTALNFMLLFVAGVMAGLHYVATLIPFGVTINIALSAVIAAFVWRSCFRVTWKDIEAEG